VSSPTTGTALEHGDIPLPRVLAAIWWLARHESGADPEGVAHALGSSTEAAWRWLRSLRDVYRVMWRDQLRGVIELAKVPLEAQGIASSASRRRCAAVGACASPGSNGSMVAR
jgi:hypothetical protein